MARPCLTRASSHEKGDSSSRAGQAPLNFALHVDRNGSLQCDDVSCRFLGVSLPRFVAPRVQAKVSANSTGWHVDVTVQWRGHLVCRYAAAMRRVTPTRIPDPAPRSLIPDAGSAGVPFVQVTAMMVGVYAIGYYLMARDPIRYCGFIWIALAGKTLGPLGFVYYASTGVLPWEFGWTCVFNI